MTDFECLIVVVTNLVWLIKDFNASNDLFLASKNFSLKKDLRINSFIVSDYKNKKFFPYFVIRFY